MKKPILIAIHGLILSGISVAASETLLDQSITFKNEPLKLQVLLVRGDRSGKAANIQAVFRNSSNQERARFDLMTPVAARADFELSKFDERFPPSIIVHIFGGADGDSYHEMNVFSEVDQKILKTFHASYYSNDYFRSENCGDLRREKSGEVFLREESTIKLTEAQLVWNRNRQKIERRDQKRIPAMVTALNNLSVHSKPRLKKKTIRTFSKGAQFEILESKFCDSRLDGEGDCSIEPFEKNRWFKIRDKNKKIYWLWEQQPFETNLSCNGRLELTE